MGVCGWVGDVGVRPRGGCWQERGEGAGRRGWGKIKIKIDKKIKDREVVVGNREVVKRQVAEVGNKGETVVIELERAKRRVFVHPIDHLCKHIKAE